jgi:hypothetical protein
MSNHPRMQTKLTASGQTVIMHNGLLQRNCACDATPGPTGECEACQKKRQAAMLQRPKNHRSVITTAPPIVDEVLHSPGQPLDGTVRMFMEPRFGHDFSQVRVHTDGKAAESARAVGASAYTVGENIVFATGRYAPANEAGQRLVAHELTHVVQQTRTPARHPSLPLTIAAQDNVAEEEANAMASMLARREYVPTLKTPLLSQVQRQTAGGGDATRQAEIAEFEADRQRFEQGQAEYFADIGEMIREHILQVAGFERDRRPSTPDEALRIVGLWGVTLAVLMRNLPQMSQSLSSQVQGPQEVQSLAQQQQTLVAALTPDGRRTYQQVLARVRREPFWRQHLDQGRIYIFPDLTGTNLYSGYTQRGRGQTDEGLTVESFVIHISKDRLEAGQVDESVATLVHELSHTLYEPSITQRSLRPFTNSLAELLADHSQIAAQRQGAADATQARQLHVRHIGQILYERTGYAEAEIFVHLQQLTHQPAVQVEGESVAGHRYILAVVEGYVQQLRNTRIPPRLLAGILRSLSRRVSILYDRRIAAASDATERRRLQLSKEQALTILRLAVSE